MEKTIENKARRGRNPWWWIPSLYFAQGLPYVVVMTVSVIMYKRLGMSNTDIALYTGWLYLPWVIKPFWSPIVDIFSTKRGWTVAMELLLAGGFAAVAFSLQASVYIQLSLASFAFVAFVSATHDIASDGFYMLALTEHQQSFYVGIRSTFYRLSTVIGQGLLVVLAGVLEGSMGDVRMAWTTTMCVLSGFFVVITLWHSYILPRPENDHKYGDGGSFKGFVKSFGHTFTTFFRKPGVFVAILFILLYRLPEAQLVKLINPFLLDPVSAGGMGLSTAQVGLVYGTIGIIGLTIGGIAGGVIVARYGLRRCLMPMAWAMSLTCLVFVYLSFFPGTPLWATSVCVFVEQLGYGIGFTPFMLYLICFSEGPLRTTHYALCTGFMALGMMLPGMMAGAIQEWLGYSNFFLWTMVCCVATIGVAALVKVPADFGKKRK